MGALHCVDGSVLSVEAVTCRDRIGQPYEITLQLARNSIPFAAVGQRCGYRLSDLAARVSAARQDPEQEAEWPDPDDRFPSPDQLAGDHEYFTLRSQERFDLPESGELRCVLRSSAVWVGECVGVGSQGGSSREQAIPAQRNPMAWRHRPGAQGRWQLTRRAVIEAWGAGGTGVRAVLTSAELVSFLDTVLSGPDRAVAAAELREEGAGWDCAVSSTGSTSTGSRRRWSRRRCPGTLA